MGNLDDEPEQKPLKEQEVLNVLKNNTNYTVNITSESAEFAFNEWIKAQNGEANGQNWQT